MKIMNILEPKFQDAIKKLQKTAMPIKTAYKLKTIVKKMDEELTKYEEFRQELLLKHGSKNEDGSLKVDESGTVQFAGVSLGMFTKELNDLANVEIDVGSLNPDEFGDKAEISTADLMALDALISN